eukprot:461440_1
MASEAQGDRTHTAFSTCIDISHTNLFSTGCDLSRTGCDLSSQNRVARRIATKMHAFGLFICFILALTCTKACHPSNGWQQRPAPQDVTYSWHNARLSSQSRMVQIKQEGFVAKELQHDEEDGMIHVYPWHNSPQDVTYPWHRANKKYSMQTNPFPSASHNTTKRRRRGSDIMQITIIIKWRTHTNSF